MLTSHLSLRSPVPWALNPCEATISKETKTGRLRGAGSWGCREIARIREHGRETRKMEIREKTGNGIRK